MSGLTQRKSAAVSRKTNKDGAEGGTNFDEENEVPREDVEEDDRDSKETRLTLMEEILLLGLKDREVAFFLIGKMLYITYSKLTLSSQNSLIIQNEMCRVVSFFDILFDINSPFCYYGKSPLLVCSIQEKFWAIYYMQKAST